MFKRINPSIAGLSLLIALIPHSTLAGDILQVVRGATNGSINQMQAITILLASGSGVNLSFLSSEQTVTKVWLDNPSFVVIDSDGCLSGLPRTEERQSISFKTTRYFISRKETAIAILSETSKAMS